LSVRSEGQSEEEGIVLIALRGYFRMIREERRFRGNLDALACENE
jgi:hypothetical protein